jgi:hypothetical protein
MPQLQKYSPPPKSSNYDIASPETLASVAAVCLRASSDEIVLHRLEDSYTNYVYRAAARGRSVVLKQSDNVARWSCRRLPAAHIEVEYRFLRACSEINTRCVRLPDALAYDSVSNTLTMSDLGCGGLPLHRVQPGSLPKPSALHDLGRFLRSIHAHSWPASLISILERERFNFGWCTFKFEAWAAHEPTWSSDLPFRHPVRYGVTAIDFTPQNCLVFPDVIGLFDFDFVSLADQLIDLVNFQSRMLFLAALGQIPRELISVVDGLLVGYYDGDLRALEENGPEWDAFCAYLAALLHYRCRRDCDDSTAVAHLPLMQRIYSGHYKSWASLRTGFLDAMQIPRAAHA